MSAPSWTRCSLLGALGSLLILTLLGSPPAGAETHLQPPDPKIAKAVDVLAKHAIDKGVDVAKVLSDQVHFPPFDANFNELEFRAVAPKFQIQIALASARGPGGDSPSLALALLSKALAQQDPSLKDAADLTPFLNRSVLPGDVKFELPPQEPRPDLPEAVRAEIHGQAMLLRRPAAGGAIAVLQRQFGLSPQEAVALWLDARTLERALEVKAAHEPEPQKVAAALKADAAKVLPEFLRDLGPRPPNEPPPPPTASLKPAGDPPSRPKGPGVLDDLARKQAWEDFKKGEYKDAEDLPFPKMKDSMHGVGGILFGDKVKGDPALPALKSVRYQPDKDAAYGALWFQFADGSRARLDHVSPEDASAAYRMLYADKDWKPGQGVPLLGMTDNLVVYQFGDREITRGQRNNVMMNPALHNTQLGWSAVMIDCLPVSRGWLLDEVKADPLLKDPEKNRVARQSIDWLFDPWRNLSRRLPDHRASIYRIVDVPMVVKKEGNALVLLRAPDPDQAYPESLRRTAFIEMHVIAQQEDDKDKVVPVKPFTEDSYQAVPELLSASYEFRRLNNFAAVLAALRWARASGADFDAPPDPPSEGPTTPDAVAVVGDDVKPIPAYKPAEALKADLTDLDGRLKKRLDADDVVKYFDLADALAKAAAAYEKAKPDSDAGKAADKEMDDLDDRIYRLAKDSADVAYVRKLLAVKADLRMEQIDVDLRPATETKDGAKYEELAKQLRTAQDAALEAKPGDEAQAAEKQVKDLTAKMAGLAKSSKEAALCRDLEADALRTELAAVENKMLFLQHSPEVRTYQRLSRWRARLKEASGKLKPDQDEAKAALNELTDDLGREINKLSDRSTDVTDYIDQAFNRFLIRRELGEDKEANP